MAHALPPGGSLSPTLLCDLQPQGRYVHPAPEGSPAYGTLPPIATKKIDLCMLTEGTQTTFLSLSTSLRVILSSKVIGSEKSGACIENFRIDNRSSFEYRLIRRTRQHNVPISWGIARNKTKFVPVFYLHPKKQILINQNHHYQCESSLTQSSHPCFHRL